MADKDILDTINPDLKTTMEKVLKECKEQGYTFIPYQGLRTLKQQNRLYRQSRPLSIIVNKIEELKKAGAPYLADQLEKCPPCNASYATNAVGGLSWHNWGEAVDCFLTIGKNAIWTDHPGYRVFGEAVGRHGLKWGGTFKSFKDLCHVQMNQKEPLDVYSYGEINDHFQSLNSE